MDIKDIFNNKIKWSFHTCMDMDVAFQLMLMGGQYSAPIESERDISMEKISKAVDIDSNIDIAFFYNAKSAVKQGSVSIGRGKSIPVQNAEKYRYGLNCKKDGKDQTFHAKISLLCYECDEGNSYRIGVYSKNMTFSGKIFEVGGVYDVDFCESGENCKEKNNRNQMISFLNKIHDSSNDKGKKWLINHSLFPSEKNGFIFSKPFRLIDIKSGKEVELLFGGCGSGSETHLYKHIGLMEDNVVREETIVLTPPFFVKQTRNQSKPSKMERFLQDTDKPENEQKPILYDLNDKRNYSASHAKVYLVTKGEDYSYFQGSANCTPRGIGVSNNNGEWENGFESVEVLVKYSLDKNEFDCIRDDIINKKGFTNSIDINESRPITNDNELAKWLTTGGTVRSVEYYDKDDNVIYTGGLCRKIKFTIEIPKTPCPECGEFDKFLKWYPLEYGSAESVLTTYKPQAQKITLIFQKRNSKSFRIQPTQQTLVICGYAMMIPEDKLRGIPKPEGTDGGVMDVYVTKLLWDCKNEDEIKEKIEEYINRVAKSGDKDTEKAKTVKSALEALLGKYGAEN